MRITSAATNGGPVQVVFTDRSGAQIEVVVRAVATGGTFVGATATRGITSVTIATLLDNGVRSNVGIDDLMYETSPASFQQPLVEPVAPGRACTFV